MNRRTLYILFTKRVKRSVYAHNCINCPRTSSHQSNTSSGENRLLMVLPSQMPLLQSNNPSARPLCTTWLCHGKVCPVMGWGRKHLLILSVLQRHNFAVKWGWGNWEEGNKSYLIWHNTSPLAWEVSYTYRLGVSSSADRILNLQAEQLDLSLLAHGFKTQMSYCRVTCYCISAASQ